MNATMTMSVLAGDPYDLALLLTGLVLLLVGGLLLLSRLRRSTHPLPYLRRNPGSSLQRRWFPVLRDALGGDYDLQVAVSLDELLRVDPTTPPRAAKPAAEKLAGREVDFVVLAAGTLEPLAVVLLQGPKQEPVFSRSALVAADWPVVALPAEPLLSSDELRSRLFAGLEGVQRAAGPASGDDWQLGAVEVAGADSEGWSLGEEPPGPSPAASTVADPAADSWPPCPACGAPRAPRRVNRGRHAGSYFLVCERYPTCQQLQPLSPRRN